MELCEDMMCERFFQILKLYFSAENKEGQKYLNYISSIIYYFYETNKILTKSC